jgi:hypothetical protein
VNNLPITALMVNLEERGKERSSRKQEEKEARIALLTGYF